jgi:Flp pilus assembly protein TadB
VFIHGVTPQPTKPPSRLNLAVRALRSPALSGRLAGGTVGGILALVLTRWPVAGVGVAALVIFWPQMFGGQRLEQTQILQLEALVMWTESLRDTITARASLEQAIPATASTAPAPIRPALTRLTGLVRSRVPLDRALLALSAELNDGSADKVIGSLILNTRQRGSGLATVLTSLTSSARAELDQRRRVSAGRATMRRSVQIVVVITIAFAVFLVLFSRDYVKPYGSFGGQVALTVVVGLFAAAFIWMRRLAGGEPSTPFLSRAEARIGNADVRVVAHLTGLSQEQAQELTTNRPAPAGASSTTGTRR